MKCIKLIKIFTIYNCHHVYHFYNLLENTNISNINKTKNNTKNNKNIIEKIYKIFNILYNIDYANKKIDNLIYAELIFSWLVKFYVKLKISKISLYYKILKIDNFKLGDNIF